LFFPKKGNILSHGPQFLTTYYYNTALEQTDNTKSFTYLITYRNKSTLSGVIQNDYVELFYFSAVSTSIGGGTHWLYWGGYLLG
jgi:hypothetical protein